MRRFRRVLVVSAASLPLSQVGHALASVLRGGAAVPGGPAHSYFAADLAASVVVLAAALVASASVLVAGRVLYGRRLRVWRRSAWPLAWTFLALAALQLEIYLVQELLERATAIDVAWRGLLGQLPVAAAAAVAVHALSTRLGAARRELRRRVEPLLVLLAPAPATPSERSSQLVVALRLGARASRAPPVLLRTAAV